MEVTDFFSWQYLGTFAGATTSVIVIMQFIKPLAKRWLPSVPTRVWVYTVSLIILAEVELFVDTPTYDGFALVALNAFAVSLAAMGAYDQLFGGEE